MCRRFAAEGYYLFVAGRTEAKIDRVVATIRASGGAAEAVATHGAPEIFNSDQGSQFASEAFTGVLKAHNIRISSHGKGRALDNIFVERLWRSVKYEKTYLKQVQSMQEAKTGLAAVSSSTTISDPIRP